MLLGVYLIGGVAHSFVDNVRNVILCLCALFSRLHPGPGFALSQQVHSKHIYLWCPRMLLFHTIASISRLLIQNIHSLGCATTYRCMLYLHVKVLTYKCSISTSPIMVLTMTGDNDDADSSSGSDSWRESCPSGTW